MFVEARCRVIDRQFAPLGPVADDQVDLGSTLVPLAPTMFDHREVGEEPLGGFPRKQECQGSWTDSSARRCHPGWKYV
jgi:hypothetical protein